MTQLKPNDDLAEYFAESVILKIRHKWENYRGLIDTPCNLVLLRDDTFLFLSTTAIDLNEHTVLLSSDDWGLKCRFPIDHIKRILVDHFMSVLETS